MIHMHVNGLLLLHLLLLNILMMSLWGIQTGSTQQVGAFPKQRCHLHLDILWRVFNTKLVYRRTSMILSVAQKSRQPARQYDRVSPNLWAQLPNWSIQRARTNTHAHKHKLTTVDKPILLLAFLSHPRHLGQNSQATIAVAWAWLPRPTLILILRSNSYSAICTISSEGLSALDV